MSLVVVTQSAAGRERWDTPGGSNNKKTKIRKDRYSALLMANDAARRMGMAKTKMEFEEDYYKSVGFASNQNTFGQKKGMYSGPQWFSEQMNNAYNSYD